MGIVQKRLVIALNKAVLNQYGVIKGGN